MVSAARREEILKLAGRVNGHGDFSYSEVLVVMAVQDVGNETGWDSECMALVKIKALSVIAICYGHGGLPLLDNKDVISISVLGKNKSVRFGLDLHNTVILEILKLP